MFLSKSKRGVLDDGVAGAQQQTDVWEQSHGERDRSIYLSIYLSQSRLTNPSTI